VQLLVHIGEEDKEVRDQIEQQNKDEGNTTKMKRTQPLWKTLHHSHSVIDVRHIPNSGISIAPQVQGQERHPQDVACELNLAMRAALQISGEQTGCFLALAEVASSLLARDAKPMKM